MRHPPLYLVVAWIAFLCAGMAALPVAAQAITDLTYDLASLSEPELLLDWAAAGTGMRAGIRITTSGDTRTYVNSSLGLDNGEAFLMDAVVSCALLGSDDERGARMWVRFRDATTPPSMCRHVEVRFARVAATYVVQLFGTPGAGSPLGELPQDWTSAAPRLRVRIRYQEVAGVGTLFFQAESSDLWTADHSGPLTADATNSLSLPVNGALFPPVAGGGEFGFGNVAAGSYFSDWQTIRLIRSSEPDTALPAPLAVSIPTLGFPGALALALCLATGGWFLVRRVGF